MMMRSSRVQATSNKAGRAMQHAVPALPRCQCRWHDGTLAAARQRLNRSTSLDMPHLRQHSAMLPPPPCTFTEKRRSVCHTPARLPVWRGALPAAPSWLQLLGWLLGERKLQTYDSMRRKPFALHTKTEASCHVRQEQ